MRIEIEYEDNVVLCYYVRITKRLSEESDKSHYVDRVITSPKLLTEREAIDWLIKYLNIVKHSMRCGGL